MAAEGALSGGSLRVPIATGWFGLFLIYLRCMPGTFAFEDSPELLACAVVLGNAHDPGYPLLCLLNRLAFLLPVGSLAYRQNLVGAAFAAAAAVMAGGLTCSVLCQQGLTGTRAGVAGGFTAVLWGFSDAFWWQAGIGDKYPLLYLLVVAVLRASWHGSIRLAALTFGLAITHHPFGLFTAPALVWAAWKRRTPAPTLVPFLIVLTALPLSLRAVYPPIRAVSAMNWGDPVTAYRLGRQLTSGRYRLAMGAAGEHHDGHLVAGAALGLKLMREELTIPGLMLAAAGGMLLLRLSPGFAVALGVCAILNLSLAIHTPEKVVRWYGPLYAMISILAGIGLGGLTDRARKWGHWKTVGAALGVVAIAGWQVNRGWTRNNLASFYAAHDAARNIMTSLPGGSIYLGRGDDDLFPIWAAQCSEGIRPDVEAVGMGTLVDLNPADAGGIRRVSERLGFPARGWDTLRWLLTSPRGIPVRYARTGYDDILWSALKLQSQRSSGLTAQWTGKFDGPGSLTSTIRMSRAYVLRGLRPAHAAATIDPQRPRDEIARDAFLQVVHSYLTLAVQLEADGMREGADEMYSRAAGLLEPFVGGRPHGVSPVDHRATVALGFSKLAAIWEQRGVDAVALRFRTVATGLERPVDGRR